MLCCTIPITFYFTAVYGWHTVEDGKSLWSELENIATNMSGPWLTMGDFNAVLHPDDRVNGQPVHDSETRDFKDFLINTGLCELKTIGRDFTWTNGHIFSKIDKGLANSDWMSNMNQLEIEVKDPGCSDHSPLVIDFIEPLNRRSRPFKFMNHFATHQEFIPMVEKGWSKPVSGCKIKQVWVKLKHVKPEMKALHHSKFSNVEERIKQTRQNLIDLQEYMRDLDQDNDMMTFAAAVYQVWIERNQKIFQAKRCEPKMVVRRIVQDIFYRGSLKKKLARRLNSLNFYP
ncbi:hypothetical protein H5410_001422 [Solanum commersonii]|uniref:Endonuclease/exonuclease/phosphatase domain-containing protein n=1 Tax=Solanum commersonii TaxID=4109 RepID=A0A9J6AZ57_SOLCO|nr:hypothetical protein H5410_001422 [Solanum commersonii]